MGKEMEDDDSIEYVIDKQKGKMFFWDKSSVGIVPIATLLSNKSIVCEHTKTKEVYVGACVKCIEKVRNKKVFRKIL